ncbi:hypothetical protein RB620_13615 [Paenibacillus sp. LHD-117]|uniref:hypothetical protein n=1 Tax=Paenibacillus sp. LHD-117 TaxID=3071412 RepID=UPI0027E1B62C|nr:hypothetical protein [Paenibacillus sp. LHD-117]MDQ6420476.1 hypothetical protein [Paenibacillus sp. LHD-117]
MRIIVFILILCFITTGCMKGASTNDEILITAEQIKDSFETHDILLSEPKGLSPENVFLRTLHGVKPETYTINENQLISFYVYSSSQETEKGLKEFEDKTATALVVPHTKYQIANVLLFYVHEGSSKDERVVEIIEGLKL